MRQRVRVTGTVQGVGFRPFVFRAATDLGLSGFVLNDSAGVLLEIEGPAPALAALVHRIESDPPPLARVDAVSVQNIAGVAGEPGFSIHESDGAGRPDVPVSVDSATCPDCLREVDDPGDRRYRYPFINCTNCGPRYTIVESVPYDRPATTMAAFVMCGLCQAEYDDPADRRFHAQPNACADCGPALAYRTPAGALVASGDDAMAVAVDALEAGAVVAIKGIGGFHLAVDAANAGAVATLRKRKARDDKPFAVMVGDIDAARALCDLDAAAEAALCSPRRPIVLATRRPAGDRRGDGVAGRLAEGVAPGLPDLGLLLPYSALHHLLLSAVARPLVFTSGNISDDPIAHTDADAVTRLGPMADGILTNDRAIHIRCDDSVVRATGGRIQTLRRSRGFAPERMALPGRARRSVLAVGAELKNTISVAKDDWVVASHHIGDLEHLATFQSFRQAMAHVSNLYGVSADVIAHDLHPEYLSTKAAHDAGMPLFPVQHHHAHIAACLVEHGEPGPVLGVAFDGLGYGTDGTLWGGEFLRADLSTFERLGHLRPLSMPGGTAAIREPWRMALAWAHAAAGADGAARVAARLHPEPEPVLALVARAYGPTTTSAGRLFDAVAALLGLRAVVTYEGQAAVELEAAARRVPRARAPVYPVDITGAVLDPRPLVAAVIADVERGRDRDEIAAGFHEGLGRGAAALAAALAADHQLATVALSGGVFQNSRLTGIVHDELAAQGLRVLVHRHIPANDGGISVGQAAVAALA
jgi:hydrogenase maturation protein HypF